MSDNTNIEPLGIRVLVRPIEQEAKTASGLILPDSAKEKPQIGEVMAVGDDEEMMVKVGQKVLYLDDGQGRPEGALPEIHRHRDQVGRCRTHHHGSHRLAGDCQIGF